MVVITMESESVSWVALGNDENEARMALMERWNDRQRYLANSGFLNEPYIVDNPRSLDKEYGFTTYNIEPGQCLTDYDI